MKIIIKNESHNKNKKVEERWIGKVVKHIHPNKCTVAQNTGIFEAVTQQDAFTIPQIPKNKAKDT